MRCVMLRQAKNSYFLCDSSKLNTGCTFTLCHANDVTAILCDAPLPDFAE